MINKIDKGNFYLVKSNENKHIRIKGDKRVYSEATELKDKPREYEEVEELMEQTDEAENSSSTAEK